MQFDKQKREFISLENLPSIEELSYKGSKVFITENQLKVMSNKYLRGESVELWLRRIARNIALVELLHLDQANNKQILDEKLEKKEKVFALVPCRVGSQRVKDKNIR